MPVIDLRDDEALVLFEWLAREIDDHKQARIAGVIDHPAEFWTLNALHCSLERQLAEPFAANYRDLLAQAREQVMAQSDPDHTYVIGGDAAP